MYELVALLIGLLIGGLYRTMWDFMKETRQKLKERKPEVGATPASYGRTNEYNVNQAGPTGLVRPKTPQQLEWEESERLREMQFNVKIREK